MFCNKCGKELSERAKFCPQCGGPADEERIDNVNEQQEEAKTFADAMQETVETAVETGMPAVTIAEMEAEQGGVVTAEKEEQPEIQSEEQPAEKVEESVSEAVVTESEEIKPEKKSKKGIIIGASAAAVVIGGAAVGYFGFSNEIMHLFMGDAGFAQMVDGKSVEYLCGGRTIETEQMDTILADYVEQMFYGTETAPITDTNALTDQIFSIYGNSSIELSAELDPGMLISLFDTEGTLNDLKIEGVIEAVQGDDCDRISYILTEKGERVFGADTYLQGDKIAMLLPELTSQSFIAEIVPEETEEAEETKEKVEFSDAEMKRIREGLVKIYSDTVAESEIEYTKSGTDLVLADCAVDSERVIIRISSEDLNGMIKEMSDFLKNDEYLRNYYVQATGEDVSEYENKFAEDESEETSSTQITIENYYTDHAQVTGKKIIVTETDAEGKTFEISFETTLGNADFHMGDEEFYIDFTQRKTEDGCGKMEIIASDAENEAPFVLDVEYSGVGVAEYCGQPVNTGKYTIKVSEKDKFFDSLLSTASEDEDEYDSEMMEETLPDSGIDFSSMLGMLKDVVIEVNTECDGNSVSSSFVLEIPLFFDIEFASRISPLGAEKPVMPDCTGAIQLDENFDMAEHEELQKEIYENLLKLADKSKILGMIVEAAEIEEDVEKLSVSESFKVHYKDYSDEAREKADATAEKIYDAFFFAVEEGYGNITLDDNYIAYTRAYNSGEELKAKFYFDENGEIQIIDDGGYYFVNFEKVKEYLDKSECPKNLYAEFISGAILEDGAVNIIYTDNPDDVLKSLPDIYNFYDGVFPVQGQEENTIGEFISGTYPALAFGESDSEYIFMDLLMEKGVMDRNAEIVAKAAMKYFDGKNSLFVNNEGIIGSVILKNNDGVWSFDGCYLYDTQIPVNELFTQDITGEFTDYLNQNVEAGHADLEIHFAADENGDVVVCGVGAVINDHELDFTGLGVPDSDHFEQGYCYIWNGALIQKSYITGLFTPDNESCVPFGSWCRITGKPLGGAARMAELLLSD